LSSHGADFLQAHGGCVRCGGGRFNALDRQPCVEVLADGERPSVLAGRGEVFGVAEGAVGDSAADLGGESCGPTEVLCGRRDRHAVTPERSAHDFAVQAELDADGLAADFNTGAFPAHTFLHRCADVDSIEAAGVRHGKRVPLDKVPWRTVQVPPTIGCGSADRVRLARHRAHCRP